MLSPALRLWEGLKPRLLLGNGGDRPQEVALLAHYRVNGQVVRRSLGRVVVGPQQARAFDLEERLTPIPRRAVDVGLELRHRGPGENLVADLMLVSEDGAEVIQVSPKDAVGEAYGGFNYPWRIGEGQETVIAVINPSAVEEVNFSLFLFSDGQSYTYEGGRLRPGEVHWVNIKELRDRRIPDQMGRLLPRGVSAGQAKLVVHGIAGVEESQRIIGEAIVVDQGRGIRATMACPNCVSEPLRVEPGVVSVNGVVGERRSVAARVYYADGSSWAINDARAIDWLESNVSVVQVVAVHNDLHNTDRFEAELRSPGTATIDGRVNHCWICTPCIDRTLALTQQVQVRVEPKVTVTSADLCSDAIRTTLEPTGATGTFTLEYLTSGGTARALVSSVSRSGGNYTDSFHVPNLVAGDQLRTIRASWTVNGVTGVGTRAYSIDVLGEYRITCYNTPLETEFTGPDVTACTSTSSCQWSTRDFKANFLSAQGEGGQGGVNLNGSGIDRTNTAILIEASCTNPPTNCPAFEGKRYRRPATLRTACGNTPTAGVTAAVRLGHPTIELRESHLNSRSGMSHSSG